MPINPYTARLEEKRRDILRRRMGIKTFLEKSYFLVRDHVDRANAVRDAQNQYAYLGREYEKVCHELGRDPYPKTVRIPPIEESRRQIAAIQARTARPAKRTVPNYICKVMVPGK